MYICYEISSQLIKEIFNFISCPIRYVVNNMRDHSQRVLGSNGIITSLAKKKVRERRIVCKNISMITT